MKKLAVLAMVLAAFSFSLSTVAADKTEKTEKKAGKTEVVKKHDAKHDAKKEEAPVANKDQAAPSQPAEQKELQPEVPAPAAKQ